MLNRIMIFGLPGSGKSTFATHLAKRLEAPCYHLDKHFYVENWVERDHGEFLRLQQDFVDQPKWVIDGNSMQSLEVRFQKADSAIYFHFPVIICLWRILKRLFHKEWPIPDLPEGCSKSIRLKLLVYTLQYHRRYWETIKRLCKKYPHVKFYVFKSDKDADRFLDEV